FCKTRLQEFPPDGEKLAETEEDLLQHRTDGTDAFDTLFIGMNFYSYETSSRGIGMGVVR
ncbi:MAG: hypothetical protein HQ522_00270, partial [Bacteroidetes bacterium]|nr:hypothetical protein [Bacteroidota bacterium]